MRFLSMSYIEGRRCGRWTSGIFRIKANMPSFLEVAFVVKISELIGAQ